MSVRMTTAVWDCPAEITTVELVVLLKLADQSNDDGVCWPSQARMARQCRKSREHVNRTIRSLVKKGLVEVEHRAGTSSRYRLHVTCDEISHPEDASPESTDAQGCDDVITGGVTKNHTGCDAQITGGVTTSSHRTVNEPSLNRSEKRQGEGRASARPPARVNGSAEKPKHEPKNRGKRMVPADWVPDDKLVAWCEKQFPTIAWQAEAEKFRDRSRAKDERYKDFAAGFRNWIRKAAEFQRRDGGGDGGRPRRMLD